MLGRRQAQESNIIHIDGFKPGYPLPRKMRKGLENLIPDDIKQPSEQEIEKMIDSIVGPDSTISQIVECGERNCYLTEISKRNFFIAINKD